MSRIQNTKLALRIKKSSTVIPKRHNFGVALPTMRVRNEIQGRNNLITKVNVLKHYECTILQYYGCVYRTTTKVLVRSTELCYIRRIMKIS
ncbi:hypothetical protein PoB_004377500 [Plakobranchus ocellatus]|uniref:Uncharacterized protein n=1 Tax=Plakobranchus ocellatus TaxID=259542 RepID=A0AAV4BCM6_9GAST|nr:hypothetical protein PoB_004377500 [Plakobranchus ocellatus]